MPDTLDERDWNILLLRIKDGNCTPFIGTGACSKMIPASSQITSEWEKKNDYQIEDYFYELYIQAYWQDCHEFATELKTQREAFNSGI